MKKEFNTRAVLLAVRKAGVIFLSNYKKNVIPRNMEDLLSQLDRIDEVCMSSLKRDLSIDFPDTPWHVGDEFDTESQRSPTAQSDYWLCDAMDGAIQYIQHIPGWTINVALIRNGNPYFSVIYDPLADEMFWAIDGGGAFMNDVPLQLNVKTDFKAMLSVFEYGHQDKSTGTLNEEIGKSVTAMIENFGIVRNYGPHGLQLAYVGAGRIDFFLQKDLDTYNWIAGILIAKEAGADILTDEGNFWTWGRESLMVSAPGVGRKFLERTSS